MNTIKQQPANSVPWKIIPGGDYFVQNEQDMVMGKFYVGLDANYSAHAANAYPKLVAQVDRLAFMAEAIDRAGDNAVPESMRGITLLQMVEESRALLRELGEGE